MADFKTNNKIIETMVLIDNFGTFVSSLIPKLENKQKIELVRFYPSILEKIKTNKLSINLEELKQITDSSKLFNVLKTYSL